MESLLGSKGRGFLRHIFQSGELEDSKKALDSGGTHYDYNLL
jgi:hypothetical protein